MTPTPRGGRLPAAPRSSASLGARRVTLSVASPDTRFIPRCLKNGSTGFRASGPQPFNDSTRACFRLAVDGRRQPGAVGTARTVEHLGARIYPDMFSLAQAHKRSTRPAFANDSCRPVRIQFANFIGPCSRPEALPVVSGPGWSIRRAPDPIQYSTASVAWVDAVTEGSSSRRIRGFSDQRLPHPSRTSISSYRDDEGPLGVACAPSQMAPGSSANPLRVGRTPRSQHHRRWTPRSGDRRCGPAGLAAAVYAASEV